MNRPKRDKPLPPLFRTPEMDLVYDNAELWVALMQPEIRYICTRIEGWRHCRLPRCRRGRTCTGSHKCNAFHHNFPPCISSNPLHQAWLAEFRRYEAELQAAYQCFAEDE